jgi:hypothetical protein
MLEAITNRPFFVTPETTANLLTVDNSRPPETARHDVPG